MNTRRSTLVGLAAGIAWLAAPRARAQSARQWRVAFVANNTSPSFEAVLGNVRKELARLGYVEGQNISYEFRHVGGQLDRHPDLAAELVRSNFDLLITTGGPATAAASKATTRIPVVFNIVADPVAIKVAASLQRPGGNMTGVTNHDPEQAKQQLSLLKEVLPQFARVAIFSEDGLPGADASGMAPIERDYFAAARSLGLQPQLVRLKGPTPDLDGAFAAATKERADAMILLEVPRAFLDGKRIAEQATAQRLPTLFPASIAGTDAMLSYSTSVLDNYARVPAIVDRIFKGTPPGEVPVEVNARRVLVVNAITAQQLGVRIPEAVLKRADRVIQ
jgi:putative ABC transport system substrate-binding protein